MTFQLGLVGKDGVVLASDRRALAFWADTGGMASSSVSKIVTNERARFAYCFWGDMLAARAATLVGQELEKGSPANESVLKSCIDQVLDEREKIEQEADLACLRGGGILLVVVRDDKPELWRLDVLKHTDSVRRAAQVDGKIVAGDAINQANFFVERYFRRSAPISELLALATHTILMAGELNPTCVSGVDLVACTSEGFHAITGTELDSLFQKSETLDRAIGDSFRTQVRP